MASSTLDKLYTMVRWPSLLYGIARDLRNVRTVEIGTPNALAKASSPKRSVDAAFVLLAGSAFSLLVLLRRFRFLLILAVSKAA